MRTPIRGRGALGLLLLLALLPGPMADAVHTVFGHPYLTLLEASIMSAPPEFVRTLTGHEQSVTAVAFSPDGKTLASASWDQTARLWNVATGEVIHTFKGHDKPVTAIAFSPDGKLLVTGSWDRTLKLWDTATGALVRNLAGHKLEVNAVAFSRDGQRVASGSRDDTVRVWNSLKGELIHTLTQERPSYIYAVAFTADGAVVGAGATGLTAWGADGVKIATVGNWRTSHRAVAVSADGKIAAAGDDRPVYLGTLKGDPKELAGHRTPGVLTLAFTADGGQLVSGGKDRTVRIWNAKSGELVKAIDAHAEIINAVAVSPDMKLLASGSEDKTIKLWSLK